MLRVLKAARDMALVEGTEGRNPFEVFMLAWAVYVGAALTLGAPPPGSVQALLPHWMVTAWYTLLCIGGLVGLAGVWMGDPIRSLLVERAAMMIICPAGLLYGVVLFVTAGSAAAVAGGITIAFSLAALGRLIRISVRLRLIRSVVSSVGRKP